MERSEAARRGHAASTSACRPGPVDVGASGRRGPRARAVGVHRQRPAGVVLEAVVRAAQADEVGPRWSRRPGKRTTWSRSHRRAATPHPGNRHGAIAVSNPLRRSGIGSVDRRVAGDRDAGQRVGSGHAQHDVRVGQHLGQRRRQDPAEPWMSDADARWSPSSQSSPCRSSMPRPSAFPAPPRGLVLLEHEHVGGRALGEATDVGAPPLEELRPDRVLRCERGPTMCARSGALRQRLEHGRVSYPVEARPDVRGSARSAGRSTARGPLIGAAPEPSPRDAGAADHPARIRRVAAPLCVRTDEGRHDELDGRGHLGAAEQQVDEGVRPGLVDRTGSGQRGRTRGPARRRRPRPASSPAPAATPSTTSCPGRVRLHPDEAVTETDAPLDDRTAAGSTAMAARSHSRRSRAGVNDSTPGRSMTTASKAGRASTATSPRLVHHDARSAAAVEPPVERGRQRARAGPRPRQSASATRDSAPRGVERRRGATLEATIFTDDGRYSDPSAQSPSRSARSSSSRRTQAARARSWTAPRTFIARCATARTASALAVSRVRRRSGTTRATTAACATGASASKTSRGSGSGSRAQHRPDLTGLAALAFPAMFEH